VPFYISEQQICSAVGDFVNLATEQASIMGRMSQNRTSLLGHGVYTFADAARFTGLRNFRVREWFNGRATVSRPGVFRSDYSGLTEQNLISFMDLVEVFIAGQLRDSGVTLQMIRKVHKRLKLRLDVSHPFCRRELLTDGSRVFTTGLDSEGDREIFESLSGQRVFPTIIKPFLKSLDYDSASRSALRWRITERVVLDPTICFGQPIVQNPGIPTVTLFKAYRANAKDAAAVARWYEITTEDVLAAVNFELSLAS
jgi:uncharacterized protein (DUF433 family)